MLAPMWLRVGLAEGCGIPMPSRSGALITTPAPANAMLSGSGCPELGT